MWEEDFKQHCREEYPKEACGLLYVEGKKVKYLRCENTARNPYNDFRIDPEEFMKAEDLGRVVGVCHSHPNLSSKPSLADLTSCESSALPWYIFSLPEEHINRIEPSGYRAPLVGRPYSFGIHDCGSIIQDYFKETLDIDLPRIETDVYENWWLNEDRLSLEFLESKGFVKVPSVRELKTHDVICMSNGAKNGWVNHLAVYLGEEKMLHHCLNRLSSIDIYGGYWLKNTRYILRHIRLS